MTIKPEATREAGDAPERIWIDRASPHYVSTAYYTRYIHGGIEYVRADLARPTGGDVEVAREVAQAWADYVRAQGGDLGGFNSFAQNLIDRIAAALRTRDDAV